MADFIEEQFPKAIRLRSRGGPTWRTQIAVTQSGHEQRNQQWSENKHKYLFDNIKNPEDIATLLAWFNSCRGRTKGFRVLDPGDYSSAHDMRDAITYTDQIIAAGDGATLVFQTVKNYAAEGLENYAREIYKLATGSMVLGYQDVSATPAWQAQDTGNRWSVVDTTGVITIAANVSPTITSISNASPAVVGAAGHSLLTGDTVYFDSFTGGTWNTVDDQRYQVIRLDANSFSVPIDGASLGIWASGNANTIPQTGENLVCGFLFDVPVRFDTDEFIITHIDANIKVCEFATDRDQATVMRALGGLSTHVTQEVTTLSTCVKLTLVDATVIGFTDHDKDLTVSGQLYEASNGYTPSDVRTSSQLNVDNLDIIGVLDSAGITAGDIQAGRYDGAAVEIFQVNWQSVTDGTIKLIKGTIGNISRGDVQYVAELRSLTHSLQQGIINAYAVQCRADLGDTKCMVRLDPPAWQASTAYTVRDDGDAGSGSVVKPAVDNGRHYVRTVAGTSNDTEGEPAFDATIGNTTVEADGVEWLTIQALTRADTVASFTSRYSFTATLLDEADDFWNLGTITWTSGLNIGRSMEVKTWTLSTQVIELYLPMPSDIAATDAFTISAGCNKDMLTDCLTKFDNVINNRAEVYVPNKDNFLSGKSD